ncbi:MAG: ACT domain-containing protein [Ignavibacteriaceae bacterium]
MKDSRLSLSILEENFAVCHLNSNDKIPDWAIKGSFYSITKTDDELSIVCLEKGVPGYVKSEKEWRAIKIEGELDFSQTGILASLAAPLDEAKISIFALSTFNTDYILVKSNKLEKAIEILSKFFNIVS